MAGSKTRFGFRGSGEEPPDSGESGAARTIIGHDIHLQKLPSGFAPPASPAISPAPIPPARIAYAPVPRAPVVATMTEAITESIPVKRRYPPRQSRIGRLLGRWTTGGHFQSRSRMGDATIVDKSKNGDINGDIKLPRDTTGRNAVLVLAIAALTFLVTFAIVKLRQRLSSKPADTHEQVVDTRPAPQSPPPAPDPPPPQPKPAAMPAPLGKATLLATPKSATPPTPKATARPAKTMRVSTSAAQPPEHLKGELLPLTP